MTFDAALALEMADLVGAAHAQYRGAGFELPDGWVQQLYLWGWDTPFPGVPAVQMGLVARKGDTLAVAIRGTANGAEWLDNFHFRQRESVFNGLDVKVHEGFDALAWNLRAGPDRRARDAVSAIIHLHKDPAPARLILTGHSLGGALATLLAVDLRDLHPAVITFGSPRVGNPAFASAYDAAVPDTWRVVNRLDPVPHLPPAHVFGIEYAHTGRAVEFDGAAAFWRNWHSLACYQDWLQGEIG